MIGVLALGQPQQLGRQRVAEATVEAVECGRHVVSERLPIACHLRQLRLDLVRVLGEGARQLAVELVGLGLGLGLGLG